MARPGRVSLPGSLASDLGQLSRSGIPSSAGRYDPEPGFGLTYGYNKPAREASSLDELRTGVVGQLIHGSKTARKS